MVMPGVRYGARLLPCVRADFMYNTFNDTAGLHFNAAATTTSCEDPIEHSYKYNERLNLKHGLGDYNDHGEGVPRQQSEDTETVTVQELVSADNASESANVKTQTAIIGHRDDFVPSQDPVRCPVRLRMTPAQPFKVGTVWRKQRVSVYTGFETSFQFKMSDLSRSCTFVKDRNFNTHHHTSCMVHGGDGFAFVLHGNPDGLSTVGQGGEGMGYQGVPNSLAVEFDTWYNPRTEDLFDDHVSVQTRGREPNDPGTPGRLGVAQPHPLADGKVHTAKIAYYRFLKYDLLPWFKGSSVLLPFLKDNGEARRVGTLAVWVDDMDTPLMVFPINLSTVLDLPGDQAYIGFTSATGNSFEKHDILKWYFCEKNECPRLFVPKDWSDEIDYHKASNTPPPP